MFLLCVCKTSWENELCVLFFLPLSCTGPADQLQPDVRRLPVPAGQAVRRALRHRRQGHPVRQAQRHLQVLAAVEGQGQQWRNKNAQAQYVLPVCNLLLLLCCRGTSDSRGRSTDWWTWRPTRWDESNISYVERLEKKKSHFLSSRSRGWRSRGRSSTCWTTSRSAPTSSSGKIVLCTNFLQSISSKPAFPTPVLLTPNYSTFPTFFFTNPSFLLFLQVRSGAPSPPPVPAIRHPRLAAGARGGDCQAEGQDDELRHHHDQLPAAGHVPQLLPQHHLQPGHPGGGRGLHARRDGEAGTRSLRTRRTRTGKGRGFHTRVYIAIPPLHLSQVVSSQLNVKNVRCHPAIGEGGLQQTRSPPFPTQKIGHKTPCFMKLCYSHIVLLFRVRIEFCTFSSLATPTCS